MSLPHLELIIAQDAAGTTTAALRVELPHRRADLVPPEAISLDTVALRSLIVTPDDYGAALTAMVFTPALREGWQRAVGFAEAIIVFARERRGTTSPRSMHPRKTARRRSCCSMSLVTWRNVRPWLSGERGGRSGR
ncbi:MAG: hypothetical protein WCK70_18760 [Chloroflexales bacterium]